MSELRESTPAAKPRAPWPPRPCTTASIMDTPQASEPSYVSHILCMLVSCDAACTDSIWSGDPALALTGSGIPADVLSESAAVAASSKLVHYTFQPSGREVWGIRRFVPDDSHLNHRVQPVIIPPGYCSACSTSGSEPCVHMIALVLLYGARSDKPIIKYSISDEEGSSMLLQSLPGLPGTAAAQAPTLSHSDTPETPAYSL